MHLSTYGIQIENVGNLNLESARYRPILIGLNLYFVFLARSFTGRSVRCGFLMHGFRDTYCCSFVVCGVSAKATDVVSLHCGFSGSEVVRRYLQLVCHVADISRYVGWTMDNISLSVIRYAERF